MIGHANFLYLGGDIHALSERYRNSAVLQDGPHRQRRREAEHS